MRRRRRLTQHDDCIYDIEDVVDHDLEVIDFQVELAKSYSDLVLLNNQERVTSKCQTDLRYQRPGNFVGLGQVFVCDRKSQDVEPEVE